MVLPFIFNTWIFGGDGAWYLSLLILLYLISPIFFNISLQKNGEIKHYVNQALETLVLAPPAGIETWEQVKPLLPQPEAYDWPAPVERQLDGVPPVQLEP